MIGQARRNRKPLRAYLQPALVYFMLIIGVLIVVIPLMWALAASFTPNHKVFEYAYPFSWRALLPVDFTLEAYDNLFARGFGRAVGNCDSFCGRRGQCAGGIRLRAL